MEKKRMIAFIVAGVILSVAGIVFLNIYINKEYLSDICISSVMLVTGTGLLLFSSSSKNKEDKQNSNG